MAQQRETQEHKAKTKSPFHKPLKASPFLVPKPKHPILHLQQTIGNRAIQGLLQAKLAINQPGDPYEQEADRVAEQVTRTPAQPPPRQTKATPLSGDLAQRDCENCEEEMEERAEEGRSGAILRKDFASAAPDVSPETETRLKAMKQGGQPLPESVRNFFESRLASDFSHVRVHTDASAAMTATGLKARAFTVGKDVVFAPGQYAPETTQGKQLLAHELAHVVQQRNAVQNDRPQVAHPESTTESEAAVVGSLVATSQKSPIIDSYGNETIQRAPDDKTPAYTTASPRVFEEMSKMSNEVAQLRAAAPPAKGPGQEAQRTFAIIKVLDENGNVKQTATGEFFGKGLHAEEQAISKINLKDISPTDRVLVVTDQWPCEEKCTPALQKLRQQTKGEFRVYSKAGVNQAGNKVVRSPKTEAKTPGPNPKLVELEEFHRPSVPGSAGPSGTTGGKPVTSGSEPGSAIKGTQSSDKSSTTKSAAGAEPVGGKTAAVPSEPAASGPKPSVNEPAGAPVKNATAGPTGFNKAPVKEPLTGKAPTSTPETTVVAEPAAEPSVRPRVTIEGKGARVRVSTGGWKWAGRVGTGATAALSVYGAISTIDDAIARIEKAQTGSVGPEVARARAAIDKVFPKADDMWKDMFRSWHEDEKYPAARDWLINNGINTLIAKGKALETMGDHLGTLYWYNQYLDDLEFDYRKQIDDLTPIDKDVNARARVLFDISEDILNQIDKWPNDTAQLTLWGIYTTFHDAAEDLSHLESHLSMRLWEYNQRKIKAHDGRIESATWFNYYAGIYGDVWYKATNKKVLHTKVPEQ